MGNFCPKAQTGKCSNYRLVTHYICYSFNDLKLNCPRLFQKSFPQTESQFNQLDIDRNGVRHGTDEAVMEGFALIATLICHQHPKNEQVAIW